MCPTHLLLKMGQTDSFTLTLSREMPHSLILTFFIFCLFFSFFCFPLSLNSLKHPESILLILFLTIPLLFPVFHFPTFFHTSASEIICIGPVKGKLFLCLLSCVFCTASLSSPHPFRWRIRPHPWAEAWQ